MPLGLVRLREILEVQIDDRMGPCRPPHGAEQVPFVAVPNDRRILDAHGSRMERRPHQGRHRCRATGPAFGVRERSARLPDPAVLRFPRAASGAELVALSPRDAGPSGVRHPAGRPLSERSPTDPGGSSADRTRAAHRFDERTVRTLPDRAGSRAPARLVGGARTAHAAGRGQGPGAGGYPRPHARRVADRPCAPDDIHRPRVAHGRPAAFTGSSRFARGKSAASGSAVPFRIDRACTAGPRPGPAPARTAPAQIPATRAHQGHGVRDRRLAAQSDRQRDALRSRRGATSTSAPVAPPIAVSFKSTTPARAWPRTNAIASSSCSTGAPSRERSTVAESACPSCSPWRASMAPTSGSTRLHSAGSASGSRFPRWSAQGRPPPRQ